MKRIIVATSLLILSVCGASESPVKIDTYHRTNQIFGVRYVEVELTSIADEVEIQDVIVNREIAKLRTRIYLSVPQ